MVTLFAHPERLYTLAVVPVLIGLMLGGWFSRRRALALLGVSPSGRALRAVTIVGLGGLLLLALTAAGPQWGEDRNQTRGVEHDLAIVLDLSRSMDAEQPSRRELALRALRDLADGLQKSGNCRLALVAFAGEARLLFPLTRDYDHFRFVLERIEAGDIAPLSPGPDEPLVSGTRIGAGIKRALQAMPATAGMSRDCLLLSDGDDPARDDEWLRGVQAAQAEQVRVHVVGLGDPTRHYPVPGVKYRGEPARTRVDDEVLRSIARRTSGTYLPGHDGPVPLGTLLPALSQSRPAGAAGDDSGRPLPVPRYLWFLLPALFMLALAMALPRLSVRRLAAVGLIASLLVGLGAAGVERDTVSAGIDAFDRRDYEAALRSWHEAEPASLDPGLLAYNEAAACYRLGRFRDAELHYRRCLEDDQAPPKRRSRALLGRGNAVFRQANGEDAALLAQAAAAYRECLQQPALDADLRADARHNLELAQTLRLAARARKPMPPEREDETGNKPKTKTPGEKQEAKQGLDGGEEYDPGDASGVAGKGGNRNSKQVVTGRLQNLPDEDRLVPLGPEETLAHLRQLERRIVTERRGYFRRPSSSAGPDW